MNELHEEVVSKHTQTQIFKPFYVAERYLHDPKKRSFYVHKYNKQYDEMLKNLAHTIDKESIVVIGLTNSPFLESITNIFQSRDLVFEYLDFGTLFSRRDEREVIKMWAGWPTFPQIYINGFLLGGFAELKLSLSDGTFGRLINIRRTKRDSNAMSPMGSLPTSPLLGSLSPNMKPMSKRLSSKKMLHFVDEKKDYELDEQFYKKCTDLGNVTLEDLDVDKKFRLDESEFKQPYGAIIQSLREINTLISPEDHLKCIERGINQISTEIEFHQKKNQEYKDEVLVGADDMIPIFIYCIIRAKIKRLYSVFRELSDKSDFKGNAGYCLACLDTAMQYIGNMKPKREIEWKWDFMLQNDFMNN